jgi:hypothetical protein
MARAGSVRNYAIEFVGGRRTGGSTIGGGNALLDAEQHALDGAEHTGDLDVGRLATAELDTTKVAAPDGTGGLTFRAELDFSGPAISPAQLTANTDDWNPTGLATAAVIRASTDASRNLTGIVAPAAPRAIALANVGAFDLVLKHDVTSTAANRFFCPNDTDVTLQKDSAVILAYDATSDRWRVVGGTGSGGSSDLAAIIAASSGQDIADALAGAAAPDAANVFATMADIAAGGGGGGGLTLLEEHTASGSTSLDFTTRNATGQSGATFQSDFDEYLIEIDHVIPATNSVQLYLRFSTDGGSTYISSGSYSWNHLFLYGSGSSGTEGGTADSFIGVGGAAVASAGKGVWGVVNVIRPGEAGTAYRTVTKDTIRDHTSVGLVHDTGIGWISTTAVDALRFLFSSGNITSGSIRIYGIVKDGGGGGAGPEDVALNFVVDGGGSAIAAGVVGFVEIPFDCDITVGKLLADQTGDIVIDIWKDTYANYPPTNADSITASAPLTISGADKSSDTTLTGWTTTITAGDILWFNVDSASDVTRVTIALTLRRT